MISHLYESRHGCRKCLRAHHTNSCKKPDGTTCDTCTRRHHPSLHNDRAALANSDHGSERFHPKTKVKNEFHFKQRCEETWHTRSQNAFNDEPKEVGSIRVSRHNCFSNTEPSIQKPMQAYAINKPCSPARTVSRTTLESYPHLKSISEQLHISGGTIDLLIETDFADAFNDKERYRREI